jgi:CRP/FNR family transcriptional regulator
MKPKPCLVPSCETCAFRSQSVICDLSDDDLAAFQKVKYSFSYEPHRAVFYEGHSCLGLYLVCSGKVKLTRSSPRGQRQITAILGPGQLIEKHGFRPGAVHEATCETMDASQICLIEKASYLALVRRDPQVMVRLIQLLSEELGKSMDHLDRFRFQSARERLAGLLLDLGDRFGQQATDGLHVGISLKREELAELAGVTVETVIRLLRAFRAEGLVCLDGRAITILNPDRLSRIARR